MHPDELAEIVRRFFRVSTIVIAALCRVRYRGRASSEAGYAWRLVVIKEDGTVLVHEGRGREPINWQPQSRVLVRSSRDSAEIVALRARPREELRVEVKGSAAVLIARLSTAKFVLEGGERDMINYIALNPHVIEPGAQLVSREVRTPHGRIDVVLRGRGGDIVVVEVKRSTAGIEAVYQLRRYVEYYRSLGVSARGVLASPDVSPQALKLLEGMGLKHVKLLPRGGRGEGTC